MKWKLCSNEMEQTFNITDENSKPICTMDTTISSKSAKWSNKKLKPRELWESVASKQEQDYATLIAAAPDLLAALEAIADCDWPEIGPIHSAAIRGVIAAIAKAKGEAA